MTRVAILLNLLLLGGCSLGLQNHRYSAASSELDDTNSGIVIGSIASGSGIVFQNLETKEEIDYLGAYAYCIRLPTGAYALTKMGTPYGLARSNEPFVFSVSAGQRNYIGTIVNQWIVDDKTFAEDRAKDHVVRGYRVPLAFGDYDYSLFDRLDELGDRYKKDCPDVDRSEIKTVLMK
jgi:hypothetical protein